MQQFLTNEKLVKMVRPIVDIGRAIEILKTIVSNSPYQDDNYGRTWCFFCSGQDEKHRDDCSYLLAKQLLEEVSINGKES